MQTTLSGVSLVFAIFVGAGAASGSARTVYTALGWTAAGLGMGLAATGIPLLIIGLVQLSVRPGDLGLRVTQRGELAVSF